MDRIDRRMVATDVLGGLVEEARHHADRERAAGDRLRTLIRAGSLAGMSALELANASGLSRPGIYEVLKGRASGPVPDLDEVVLAVLAARGGATRSQLAESLGVREDELNYAVEQLIQRGAIVPASAGYGGEPVDDIVILGTRGEELISNELQRLLTRRPDRWVAYLAVRPDESELLYRLAVERFGPNRASLLPETVRSDMASPELALVFDASSGVDLFNRAAAAWHQLRAAARLAPAPAEVVALSAPKLRSEVLEAFAGGLAKACPALEKEVERALQEATPSDDEFVLCTRALTEAARALRRSVGQENDPPPLVDGEAAFSELQPVAGLPLDGDREKARRALLRALERATDTFGPIPAGRLASGGVVQSVKPGRFDLVDIARLSGEAIGFASLTATARIDPVERLAWVTSPTPASAADHSQPSMTERVESALMGSMSWDDVVTHLLRTVGENETEAARAFVYAFSYRLLDPDAEEERQAAGGPFGASIEGQGGQLPPPLADVGLEIVAAWDDYAAKTAHPVALSRLHDLLWECGHGERHSHARTAIAAYLDLANGDWDPITRVACATRGLELARAINDRASVAEGVGHCLELAEAAISADERVPGVALRALSPLIRLPRELRPKLLPELIRGARDRYDTDLPWIRQSFTALLATVVGPSEQEALWREEVEEWRERAETTSGVMRHEHRQHALQLALDHGFTDLAEQVRRDIEAMPREEFDLKTTSAEIEVPADEIDRLVEWIADAGNWPRALRRLGAQGPPTGQVAANEAAVRKAMADFPLRSLFGEQIIGHHMALVFRADTPERRFRLDMSRQESYGIGLFAYVVVRALDRLVSDFGEPTEDLLAESLSTKLISGTLARRCARAMGYYWRGEYDAAGHLLAPRIEAIIRQLCVAVGCSVTKLPIGDKPGGVMTLALLLDKLDGHIDESWRRYLCNALTDQLGVNLRNQISHGLVEEVDRVHAAVLIHIVLCLALLGVSG
jgi:Domain of unknown function (DUF4209)